MYNLVILLLIIIGLVFHRYLSAYSESEILPYPVGFHVFSSLFALIYVVGFIWMFGFWLGITIALLCFFQIVYASILWIFLLPWLIGLKQRRPFIFNLGSQNELPPVNITVYGGFSLLVIILGGFTIGNFFLSDYGSVYRSITDNSVNLLIIAIVILVLGNVVRKFVMRYT
ncbi:hypothetical protein B1778_04400 [Dehalococcoides mccartyi]|uniref:Putative membrane protein n=1 Tax=Dehalococcoides mccartyi TaxID=61435 RepID=A0A142VA27_9CHLR|nr:putative membrane protein [Dehalococcoides mccartyi BTF08]AMU86690.1 putative membrane protein [Dehalococcoides mccartyi]AQU05976.1 hypothetical protein B1777_04585 [Dehalococcoides mccartyi]AQU07421.1 hypothetical protein B1778_04400 [Dehalococcoides mccartyi]